MIVLYNTLQLFIFIAILPLAPILFLLRGKNWRRLAARCGAGLAIVAPSQRKNDETIWLHALSVGEVTSALPLLTGLRRSYPHKRLVVSVATATGKKLADNLLAKTADAIIEGPIDLLPVVNRFLSIIQPQLFILIETDFWPNLLHQLHRRKIPALLVNGRISGESMSRYHKMKLAFLPIFRTFSALCMQTGNDRENMIDFGIPAEKIYTLGNLKLDTPLIADPNQLQNIKNLLPRERPVFICGSTHPGEEEILFDGFLRARRSHPQLFMIIAPRDPRRGDALRAMASRLGLTSILRSRDIYGGEDILIINTIGELVDFYRLAHIAFVGGSLSNDGGHNPIEPATAGVPVLFGPHMEDFSEVAATLLHNGGALQIGGARELADQLTRFLASEDRRILFGNAAKQTVIQLGGVVDAHLRLIKNFL